MADTNHDGIEDLVQPVHVTDWPQRPLPVAPVDVNLTSSNVNVTLRGTPTASTDAQGFWEYLRQRTEAISFGNYSNFIEEVLCAGKTTTGMQDLTPFRNAIGPRVSGVDTYQLLRAATEAFLLLECGTTATPISGKSPESRFGGMSFDATALNAKLNAYLGTNGTTPYIDRITNAYLRHDVASPPADAEQPIFCDDIDAKVLQPCFIELIWSYWEEELGLVQVINAISLRFQNKRAPGDRDVLANFETHPLRPLANLLWGYVQDEDHRLTVARRS